MRTICFAATSHGSVPFPALLMCIGTTALRPLMHSGFDVAACMQYRNWVSIHCANCQWSNMKLCGLEGIRTWPPFSIPRDPPPSATLNSPVLDRSVPLGGVRLGSVSRRRRRRALSQEERPERGNFALDLICR